MSATSSTSRVRDAIYAEFMYGFGAPSTGDHAVDLGEPRGYTKSGTVYRQEFERGVALANIGDAHVSVALDRPHRDLDGVVRTVVELPPHAADALLLEPARLRAVPRQDAHPVGSAAS